MALKLAIADGLREQEVDTWHFSQHPFQQRMDHQVQQCQWSGLSWQVLKQNNISPPMFYEAIVPDGEIAPNLDLLVLWRDVGV